MSDQGGWDGRLARLSEICENTSLRVVVGDSVAEAARGQLATLCSSRLGRDVRRHREFGRVLLSFVMECKSRHESILVASPSAIEPWAIHCAEVMRVPCVRMFVGSRADIDGISILADSDQGVCRDAASIALGDRVLIAGVRRGGRIERAAKRRLELHGDAAVTVAVSEGQSSACADLLEAGAVGWFVSSKRITSGLAPRGVPDTATDSIPKGARFNVDERFSDGWERSEGEWLVHCTRGANGPWPFETERQYYDAILFGSDQVTQRTALDSLLRIVRKASLHANAIATRRVDPVVCFSGLALQTLLSRRCYRPHLGRWDFEPYGVAIRLEAARKLGVRPVVYGEPRDRALLSAADRFLFHPRGRTYDWRSEREWRASQSIDLRSVYPEDIRLFAHDSARSRKLLAGCPWSVTYLRLALQ